MFLLLTQTGKKQPRARSGHQLTEESIQPGVVWRCLCKHTQKAAACQAEGAVSLWEGTEPCRDTEDKFSCNSRQTTAVFFVTQTPLTATWPSKRRGTAEAIHRRTEMVKKLSEGRTAKALQWTDEDRNPTASVQGLCLPFPAPSHRQPSC